jgi:hypothetical protein
MDNFFEKIFSEDPKPPKSISLEIDVLENENQTETKISDIFEICLHMFVYGIKYKKLEVCLKLFKYLLKNIVLLKGRTFFHIIMLCTSFLNY